MALAAEQGASPFITEYHPEENNAEVVTCMDDRWVVSLPEGVAPPPEEAFLFTQIGGGWHGVTVDIKTMRAIYGISDTPESEKFLAEDIDVVAEANGIVLLNHEICAAREGEEEVSGRIRAGGEELFQLAKEISDNKLQRPTFNQIVKATGSEALRHATHMSDGRDLAQLAAVEHAGSRVAVIHDPEQALRVKDAYKAGTPAYCLSRGRYDKIFNPLLGAEIVGGIDVGEGLELARAVTDVRHAAIIQHLRQATGNDIVVEHYGK
jgi:hypothetical protein